MRLPWGNFGQVMQIVWGISASSSGSSFGNLRNPWKILTKSSGNLWQVPWGVLVGICEILRRSGPSPAGIPGRQLWEIRTEILRGRHANRLRVLGILLGEFLGKSTKAVGLFGQVLGAFLGECLGEASEK